MKCLACGFRSEYPDDVIVHVPGGPRTVVIGAVKKKEMVFDLLVAGWEKDAVKATHGRAHYPRLKPPIWAVESEVDTGATQVLFDFNKLLLSAAPKKLMVTKRRKSNLEFTRFLQDAAIGHNRAGDIHVAYIPPFNESKKKARRASKEWLVDQGDVPFALYVIRGSNPDKIVDPF